MAASVAVGVAITRAQGEQTIRNVMAINAAEDQECASA